LEKAGSFDPKLAELWQKTAEQRDQLLKLIAERNAPPDLVAQLRQLKEILPAPASAPAPQLDLLAVLTQVKQLQGDPFSALEKLKAFLPESPKQEPATSGLEQLKNVMEIVGQAKEVFAPAAPPVATAATGPEESAWERILVNLAGQAGPLAAAMPAIIAAFKGTPTPHLMPGAGAPPLVLTGNPYKDQQAMRAYTETQRAGDASVMPPTNPAASAPAQPPGQQPTTQPSAEDSMLAQVGGLIAQALSAMNRGLDGHRIAESFIDLNGELAFDAIASQIKAAGASAIVQMAKGISELRPQVDAFQGPLTSFLTEFSEGPEWIEPEEKEEPKETKGRAKA
jgi:hypothetical protein